MSARYRAEDRSAPHTNAESSPFFVTAYFRIPGLDDKWDSAFGEDSDGGFIRQDWDDEAERRALDFWLSGASSKAADYERDSFSLVDVRLFHHDDILSVTYLFKARQLVSGEDAAHQFAAFSRECNAKAFSLKRHEGHYEAIAGHEATDGDDGQYFNALRLALAHRLECLCATLCVELAQVEVARTENNTFNFTPFDEDALVLTDGIYFTDKVFLPVCFMNIRKGSSAPAFSEELEVGEPGDTKCLFQEDYSIGASGDGENGGRQRHELAVKRRVPTKGFANVFKYRIAKSDPMTNTVFDTDKDAPTNINIPGKGYLKIFQAGSGLVIEDLMVDQIEDVFSTLNAMTARKVLLVHRQRELDDFVSGDTLRSDMDSIFSRREGMSFSSPDFSEKISDTGVRIMEMEARFSRWIDEANRFEDLVSSCLLSDDFGRRIAGEYLVSTKTLDMLAQYRKLLSSWRESYRAQYGSLEFIKTMGDYVDSHQEAERQRRERRVGTALNIVAIFAIVSAVKDGSDLFMSLVDHAGVHDAATPARLMIAIASCVLLILCLSFVLWWTWKANKVDLAQHKRERGRIRRIVGGVRPQLRLLFLCIFLCCLAIVLGGVWGAMLLS